MSEAITPYEKAVWDAENALHIAQRELMEAREQFARKSKLCADLLERYKHVSELWVVNTDGRLWLCGNVPGALLERLETDEFEALSPLLTEVSRNA